VADRFDFRSTGNEVGKEVNRDAHEANDHVVDASDCQAHEVRGDEAGAARSREASLRVDNSFNVVLAPRLQN